MEYFYISYTSIKKSGFLYSFWWKNLAAFGVFIVEQLINICGELAYLYSNIY